MLWSINPHIKFDVIVVISEAFIMYMYSTQRSVTFDMRRFTKTLTYLQVQVETVQSLRLCLFVNILAAELCTHRFPSVD